MLNFLKFNNAVPVALGVLFLGGGSAFAAANPQVLYSAEQQVTSVDNTYLARVNLAAYTPRIDILAVTEDGESYFVRYKFRTIDVDNAVWRDVTKLQSLTVAKSLLAGRDLGLYVAGQLGDLISHEMDRLKESQNIALKKISRKQVATVYSGLVGAFLDDSTETLPGYKPVIPEPKPGPTEPYTPIAKAPDAPVQHNEPPADTSGGATSTPAQATQALTQEQIEQLIAQRVQEILAGQQNPPPQEGDGSGSGGGDTPPAEEPPADEPPASEDPSSDTPADQGAEAGAPAGDQAPPADQPAETPAP